MATVHLLIKGEVQGVFFRATARKEAEKRGITGWVKNTPEGHVEIEATGTEDLLQRFISWCRQGPPKAVVQDVIISQLPEKKYKEFSVIR